jgi:hypothetical protein
MAGGEQQAVLPDEGEVDTRADGQPSVSGQDILRTLSKFWDKVPHSDNTVRISSYHGILFCWTMTSQTDNPCHQDNISVSGGWIVPLPPRLSLNIGHLGSSKAHSPAFQIQFKCSSKHFGCLQRPLHTLDFCLFISQLCYAMSTNIHPLHFRHHVCVVFVFFFF